MDPLIHGYLDGELDALTNRSVEDHLSTCTHCTEELASFRELRAGLRRPGLYYGASDRVVKRVRSGVRQSVDFDERRRFNWRPYAAAASFLVVFFIAWDFSRRGFAPPLPDYAMVQEAVVDSHVRSLMADHLVDLRSSDKHTVKPWFDGKLDFAPPVARLDGTEFPLAGGRLDYINGHPAAAVVYRHAKHWINLFIWPSTGRDTAASTSTDRGYNLVHWTDYGMTYWAASDVSAPDLQTFAGLVEKSE